MLTLCNLSLYAFAKMIHWSFIAVVSHAIVGDRTVCSYLQIRLNNLLLTCMLHCLLRSVSHSASQWIHCWCINWSLYGTSWCTYIYCLIYYRLTHVVTFVQSYVVCAASFNVTFVINTVSMKLNKMVVKSISPLSEPIFLGSKFQFVNT